MSKATSTSARRVLRVLKILKGHSLRGLSNGDVAKALGESPVNVTRALQALAEEGMVTQLDTGRWAHSVALL
ncbi:MAG: helix-turn-helix domain-containing protein, partial [Proteobacteria bacterium]|nr:helix-turn-helix domain-containing protein [Pseudomonadota bacterium]